MMKYLKAEHVKLKHTFGGKIPVIAPCLMLLLAFVLMGGLVAAFPAAAFNWWYSLFLSGSLSITCYLSIKKDKKGKYHNIRLLPILPQKSWLGKVLYCALGLFASNVILYIGTLLAGAVFGTTISSLNGLSAAFLLTVTYLWEVPLFLFLSARFGMFMSVFLSVILSVSGILTVTDSSPWWLYPAAIPVRLMCPVLGLLPNGLPVVAGSELGNPNVILPGIVLSVVWFLVFVIVTSIWFQHWEEK